MAWRKVKSDNDKKFTIQDMIKKYIVENWITSSMII